MLFVNTQFSFTSAKYLYNKRFILFYPGNFKFLIQTGKALITFYCLHVQQPKLREWLKQQSFTFDFHVRQRYNLLNQTKPGVNFNCIYNNKKCITLMLLYMNWNNIFFFMEICTSRSVKK